MRDAYQHACGLGPTTPMQDGAIERIVGPANDGAETPMIIQATAAAKVSLLNMASAFQDDAAASLRTRIAMFRRGSM